MMTAFVSLVTSLVASTLADDPSLHAGQPLSIEIRAEDPVLEDHGASRRFRFVSDCDGTVFVFVLAADKDPFLLIEESDGTALAEDDNSGGGKTPYIEHSVSAGDALTIVVALNGDGAGSDAAGAVEIHVETSPETDVTRHAAEEGAARLRAVKSNSTLSPDASRSAIRAIVDELILVDGAARSRKIFGVMWSLGGAAYELDDDATARVAWTHCRSDEERVRSPDHTLLQAVRGNLGVACERMGDLAAAKELKDLMFAALSRTLPDDDPKMQIARLQRAEILRQLGQYEEAVALQRTALEYLSRTRAPTDELLLQAQYNLAMTLGTINGSAKELASLETIVATLVKSLGPTHLRSLKYQIYLASWLTEAGELERSRILFESVLAALEKALPADHLQLADARAEFAITLYAIGDLDAARAFFERAIATYERELPADHRELMLARGNLSGLMRRQGDLEGARRLQAECLATLERTRSEDNADLLTARFQLASTLSALGQLDEALAMQEAINETWTRIRAADDPALQDLRVSLATTLERLERFDRARDLMRGVLDVRVRTLRPGDPILQMTREDLLALETRQRNFESARSLAEGLAQDLTKGVTDAVVALSPRETEQVALTRAHGIDRILTLAAAIDDAAVKRHLHAVAWSLIETVRSAAATSTRIVRASTKGTESDALASARVAITSAGREVARYATLPDSHDGLVDATRRLDAAEKQLRALLAAKIRFEPPSVEAVAAVLPSNAAAVSYWRASLDARDAGFRDDTSSHLFAFVLKSGGTPTAVDLGPLAKVTAAVHAWRAAIGATSGRSRPILADPKNAATDGSTRDVETAAGVALRALVFDPLREACGDARRVIFVPDDVLHLAPLDALPDGSGLLGDHLTIENRSSFGELLEPPHAAPKNGTLVLVGGIDFGAPGNGNAFSPLPGTVQEVEAIADLRRATASEPTEPTDPSEKLEIEVLAGDDATKARLFDLAPRARFLHLATHGEFSSATGASARDARFDDRVKGFAPLTLCGVALSGANAPPDALGLRDGILTGEEIATLDLSNCELAVLSACETNVGEQRPGQGVASLEAALAAAGARTIVTSLWRVPDESTRQLMTEFYRRVWVEKEPKQKALWEAKKLLRDSKGADGRPLNSVRDWAAWVLTGEPE